MKTPKKKTKTEIQFQIKTILSEEEKLKEWGEGEWLKEPDQVTFEYRGIQCLVQRMMARETDQSIFGGHLCGYIRIPKDHCLYGKDLELSSSHIEVHGGVTYNEMEGENHWIGFDCAHSYDTIPSMVEMRKKIKKDMLEKHPWILEKSPIFIEGYRNIQYVIGECKSMVDQLLSINNLNSSTTTCEGCGDFEKENPFDKPCEPETHST